MESKHTINHDNIIANQLAGMSLEEAIFQHGYSSGHDAGYERGKREAQPGPRWGNCAKRMPVDDSFEDYPRKYIVRGYNDGRRGEVDIHHVTFKEMEYVNQAYDYCEWLNEQPAAVSQDAHEKEIMMQAFDKVRQIFEGRQWVMDGRGSYPYNDDRYKEEVRYMYDEFDKVFKDTWGNIESKSFEYREAIISEYLNGAAAAGREEDAVVFAEWCANNYSWEHDPTSYEYQWLEANNFYTTAELYKLFKQQHNP